MIGEGEWRNNLRELQKLAENERGRGLKIMMDRGGTESEQVMYENFVSSGKAAQAADESIAALGVSPTAYADAKTKHDKWVAEHGEMPTLAITGGTKPTFSATNSIMSLQALEATNPAYAKLIKEEAAAFQFDSRSTNGALGGADEVARLIQVALSSQTVSDDISKKVSVDTLRQAIQEAITNSFQNATFSIR